MLLFGYFFNIESIAILISELFDKCALLYVIISNLSLLYYLFILS